MAWRGGDSEGQRGAVYIAGAQRDDERRILIGADRLRLRHRQIVDSDDVDVHHRHVAIVRAVENTVGKTVGTVEIVSRCIVERTVGVERKGQRASRTTDKYSRGARQ